MGLSLTVLGCAGTYPAADRACSSYLVEHEGYRLVLDLGNGALSNLQRVCDPAEIDALVLSHLHPDHFVDLYGLYYALRFHRDGPQSVTVLAPDGAQAHIAKLLLGDAGEGFGQVCRFSTAAAGETHELGPLRLRTFAAAHPVETLALRVETAAATLAYSADSGPTPALVDCARGAGLLVADASWLAADGPFPENLHMTARQAGEHAAAAEVGTLVVSHVFPAYDPARAAEEAAEVFDGAIVAARDLQEHTL